MSTAKTRGKRRERGEIETLPSGALRVKVYAGIDPLTGRRHFLRETVPAGPQAVDEADKVRTRLLNQVDEQRNPRTKATVNQLMDRYLELLDVDVTTREGYEGYIRNHIRPLLGKLSLARLDGETLDSFYLILRTCRKHCGGKGKHECKPLSESSIRQIHWCLSGALKRAIRWRWISVNPLDQAEPPHSVKADPHPPTPEQAAAIVNKAFQNLPWGMLVWLAMTTGARRGELCALRLSNLDLEAGVLSIKASIGQSGSKTWEKVTKTHQQRRITLDPDTIDLLKLYLQQRQDEAKSVDVKIAKDGRLFSPSVDHSTWLKPGTVSQRYVRMCAKLGWDMNLHELRHYSATELIAAGTDVRTVAGRLGHGGGGATTLRVYSAWVSEADQRAAGNLGGRMPASPVLVSKDGKPLAVRGDEPTGPYQQIAADLRGAITCGALPPGEQLPTFADLAKRYEVKTSTAQRAVAELKTEGLVKVSRGRRATVSRPDEAADQLAKVVNLRSGKAAG